MTTRFDELYEKYSTKAHLTLAKQELEDIFNACLEQIPDLKLIVITGTTPSFNDGDVCRHSEDVSLFTSTKIFSESGLFEIAIDNSDTKEDFISSIPIKGFSIPDSVDLEAIIKSVGFSYSTEKNSDLQRAMRILESQNLTQTIYDTNYSLVVSKEDDRLKIVHNNYYCDY